MNISVRKINQPETVKTTPQPEEKEPQIKWYQKKLQPNLCAGRVITSLF